MDKVYKDTLRQRLKGLSGIGAIFNLINEGAPPEQVETAVQALEAQRPPAKREITLRDTPAPTTIFGKSLIAQNAIDDLNLIARLPMVTGAAGMPDMHRTAAGAVPVGGVVVMDGWIDPEIVSADIACSVMYSAALDTHPWRDGDRAKLEHLLRAETYFGAEMNPDNSAWRDTSLKVVQAQTEQQLTTEAGREALRGVLGQLPTQFGTSGDGNHFVSFGYNDLRRLAILSHFGSRGMGATVHKVITAAAREIYRYPEGVQTAAIEIDTPLGQDYVALLSFCGAIAELGHRWLHQKLWKLLGLDTGRMLRHVAYSRHNFAWVDGRQVIHRKGATPVPAGYQGVIPATMGHPSRIVVGRGNADAYDSAPHGGGRVLSRGAALQQFKGINTAEDVLRKYDVTLIGAGNDEHPDAYKPIDDVMTASSNLVRTIDRFYPKVVRMAPPRGRWR